MQKEKLSKCLEVLDISQDWLDLLDTILKKYNIVNDDDVKMFLAQTSHESMNYKRLEESFKYKAESLLRVFPKYVKDLDDANNLLELGAEAVANRVYGGRLGNAKDEGFKYRGRGIIQLTGKINYIEYGRLLDIDLVNNPDLAKDKEVALKVACLYYTSRGCLGTDINTCTKKINGGLNGLDDRKNRLNKLLNV